MSILAILHRFGLNTALAAGLVVMPAVVAVGYWADDGGRSAAHGLGLRGSLDADAPPTPGGPSIAEPVRRVTR